MTAAEKAVVIGRQAPLPSRMSRATSTLTRIAALDLGQPVQQGAERRAAGRRAGVVDRVGAGGTGLAVEGQRPQREQRVAGTAYQATVHPAVVSVLLLALDLVPVRTIDRVAGHGPVTTARIRRDRNGRVDVRREVAGAVAADHPFVVIHHGSFAGVRDLSPSAGQTHLDVVATRRLYFLQPTPCGQRLCSSQRIRWVGPPLVHNECTGLPTRRATPVHRVIRGLSTDRLGPVPDRSYRERTASVGRVGLSYPARIIDSTRRVGGG